MPDSYHVEQVNIDNRFSHLDCVLLTPREGVAIACLEEFPYGLPAYLKDWDIIDMLFEITKAHMGCNNLTLNDHSVVIPSGEIHDPLEKQLKARKFEVTRLTYESVYWLGGSFRCVHQPLIRIKV